MTQQPQSPFFRLPREIRDLIYEFYVYEDEGYFYDYEARKMQLRSKGLYQRVSLGFIYTCTQVADEMKGVAFKVNTLTFRTGASEDDGGEFWGLKSRAGRFRCLLAYTFWTKFEMVRITGSLATRAIVDEVARKYPNVGLWFELLLREWTWGWPGDWPVPHGGYAVDLAMSEFFRDALNYCRELISESKSSEFTALASDALTPGHRYIKGITVPAFIESATDSIARWKAVPWMIPSNHDLKLTESLLRSSLSDA
ncbi:hypothetical protein BDV96DRAFT_186205 [Lophiotrema nucula]|uniref:F-box domain-containing protein n=1 Tax=Lophiotrema nucula TaxID=690887 RepID=A0A6A5YWA5_9PLEO|nr:hypothetical protein BDV96DRAFT_186205 [Lophiotrema nucula]